jgi:beta-phosphoglucomutase
MAPARTTGSSARAVLWDLDGTLVDSGDYHFQSWRSAMAAAGVDVTRERFLASFGQKNDRILREWLGSAASADEIRRLGDTKEAEYRRLAREGGLTALPGAREWVTRLRAAGWRQAIASSAPRENIDVMLELIGLAGLFDALVAAEDVTTGKPDPEVFLTAAARLGVAPLRAVVVEDAEAGLEAARRAGMPSIGVHATATLQADVAVRSLVDLPPDAFDRLVPAPA